MSEHTFHTIGKCSASGVIRGSWGVAARLMKKLVSEKRSDLQ